ncbi:Reverse transcriptase domain [Cinara cedri]|uniref:Reverse transcriptase domain n=1 Tax=Cinara cedri TaxID=506608 RepID=A0A5E4LZD9_9HEMI|nr:Reverse transcriptase domain [Cinara cedri]
MNNVIKTGKLPKPFVITIEEVLKTVLHRPAYDILKKILLSNITVQRRIDEMSHDVESYLCNYLQTTYFSIQLDESTLPDNEALLLAYIRFVMDQEIHEELLFARTLTTDTRSESIFNVLKDYFTDKAIPLTNIISAATDGAPAMVGRYRGFLSHLKPVYKHKTYVPELFAIHCVINRQHLVAKNLSARLHKSLQLIINATILEFLDDKDLILKEHFIQRKQDIAYSTYLFAKLNEVNLQLQGDNLNLIKTKPIIVAFLVRINLMMQNIGRREFSQFPKLSLMNCQDDDISAYVQHLNVLHTDFKTRFEDILTKTIPQWIINPYSDIEESDIALQEELIGISTNEELKVQFRNGEQQFWLHRDIPVTYPTLWSIARKFLIAFPSSYCVEKGFGTVGSTKIENIGTWSTRKIVWEPQEYGVPQGSIISVALFLVAINDISEGVHNLNIPLLYADDLTIICRSSNSNTIQQLLQDSTNKFTSWSKTSGFRFASNKISLILISRKN